MEKIVLATTNKNKIKEYQTMMGKDYKFLSLDDIGFTKEIKETGDTCQENAKIKAQEVFDFLKKDGKDYAVLADDSGLFIQALNGEPGVHSARYSGGEHTDEANRNKVLKNMQGRMDRTAYFECVICYMYHELGDEKIRLFKGTTYGEITTEKIGSDKFGYDCIFYSTELRKTFGEATEEEKDSVSHRGRAVRELMRWLVPKNPNFDRTLKFNK